MDLNSIPIMQALKDRLDWLSQKQKIIAENVANADTPGYIAKDLTPQDFSSLLDNAPAQAKSGMQMRVHLKSSKAGHTGGMGAVSGGAKIIDAKIIDASPNGNTVVLEEEMMKMSKTQMEYSMVTNLYKKHVGLLKTALGRGR